MKRALSPPSVPSLARRHPLLVASLAAVLLLGIGTVTGGQAATFTVNSTTDAVDANPGDGVCATAAGVCTLRASIQETNALPGADTIILPASIYTLTIPGTFEDLAATGDLDITDNLTITGAGAVSTIVDGGQIDGVLQVIGGITVRISGVTIQNGKYGLLHFCRSDPCATLTLTSVTISRNTGSGISNGIPSSAMLALDSVTISQNVSDRGAGLDNSGTATLTNTTIDGNTAKCLGGGIRNVGMLILENVTIGNNTALGAFPCFTSRRSVRFHASPPVVVWAVAFSIKASRA